MRRVAAVAVLVAIGCASQKGAVRETAQTAPAEPAGTTTSPAPTASAPTTPGPTEPEAKKESQFSPVATGQQPTAETAAAERALKSKNYELAIQEARRALARNERYVPAMVLLGKAYFHLRKHELASAIFDTAAQIDDRNAEIYFMRGHLALAKDDKPAALAAFKAATERDAQHAAAWNDLAAQYLVAHNFEQARVAAERAVALAPRFVKARINLGSALRGLKQYREAEAAYRKALEIEPNQATAHFNLGILYLDAESFPGLDTVGRLDQAVAQLQKYKQIAFKLPKEDPADSYIDEAQKLKDRERKKQERMKKQQERAQPKPAPGGGAATRAPQSSGGNPK